MASPQKENGFTPIANEIIEALARMKFTELETQALFLIFRNTYGWNRKIWKVRRWKVFEQIGITPNRIKDTLYKLADRNIINLDWQAKTISFQKDYSIWQSLLSTKKIKTKLKKQGIIKDKKVDESVNFEKLTNRSSKSCPIGQVKVDESVNFESCQPNDGIALPEPKERRKERKKENLFFLDHSTCTEEPVKNDEKEKKEEIAFQETKKMIQKICPTFNNSNIVIGNAVRRISQFPLEQRKAVIENAGLSGIKVGQVLSYIQNGLDNYDKYYGNSASKKKEPEIFTLSDEAREKAQEEEKRRNARIRAEQEAKRESRKKG